MRRMPVIHIMETLIRISDEGTESTVLASGFRAPNGLFVDEVFFCSDQEGHWMPANRINRIEPGGFYGNKWTGHEDRDRSDYDRPLLWIHPVSIVHHRRSCRSMIRPGVNSMVDCSDCPGTGSVYLILGDEVDEPCIRGVVPLPIKVPTGLMSGVDSAASDSSLHLCGLVGWSSDASEDGGSIA